MRLAVAAPCLLLAACSSFGFSGQSVELYPLPERDALELRLVYAGLAPGDAKPEEAARALARIAAGAPHFVVGGWPWELDAGRPLDDEDDDAPPAVREAHAWLTSFEVVDAGLFREAEGASYDAWQVLRWADATRGIERLNAAISALWLDEPDGPPVDDPELAARFEEAARAGHRWVTFDGDTLVVSFPTSPAANAALLRELAGDDGDAFLPPLSTCVLRDDLATLSWRADDEGRIAFSFGPEDARAPERLTRALDALLEDGAGREPPAWVRERLRALRSAARR